ncbi:MAG TPA: nucleotidyl transferase AbiEii/AbiGii toxin family protein [Chthonomonadaceae bacterium]|nr:nucleotidyl transferase AbiEii/AbiGii toxin family protein [Chthonomonadaceae bacterium]
MDTIATASALDRRDLFQETANWRGLSPLVIEKDFWVCWTLKQMFALPSLGPNLIFKGGTSLSKVFRLIERFSEDIDLSLRRDYLGFSGENDPEQAASKNQQRNRVLALREKCRLVVQNEVKEALTAAFQQVLGTEAWSLESDPDDENTLNFTYPAAIASDAPGATYIRRKVKLEMGAGSDPYPIGTHSIQPYAAEELPSAFTAPACDVIVMEAERTFWEKATLLHTEYHRPEDKPTPIRLSRHYYDLMRVAASETGARAIADQNLLARVAAHKSVYFASNWAHYETARPGSLHILPAPERLEDVQRDYAGMQDMFFDSYPTFEELLAATTDLEQRINSSV